MISKSNWVPAGLGILLAEAVLEIVALWRLISLQMLPGRYVAAAGVILAACFAVSAVLLFAGINKGAGMGRRVRRILGIILAAVVGIGSVGATMVAGKIGSTVNTVTETSADSPDAMVGVYVLAEDDAAEIADLKNVTFGVMENFDQANTDQAIRALDQELYGGEDSSRDAEDSVDSTGGADTEESSGGITTKAYDSMAEVAQALYDQDVRAIILNEAYADALEDVDEFSDFAARTKLLEEIPVYSSNDTAEGPVRPSASAENAESGETADTEATENPAEASTENAADASSSSDITSKPFVLYISGSDTRSQILDVSRSDVNILMVVNPKTRQILLLNTPRDYYVPNPAGKGALDKLTHLGIYGINCSMQGLADLYQTDIDYYVQMNFTGFVKLIDAIGGVTVYSDNAFENLGYKFEKGNNQLDGQAALAFARDRYHQKTGDNARGRHQMVIIEAVIQKLSSSGTSVLMNYNEILDSLSGMFKTNLSSDEISSLVRMQLDEGGSWNVRSYAVTGKGGSETTYSMPRFHAYVMFQDPAMVKHGSELIQKVREGETLTADDVK